MTRGKMQVEFKTENIKGKQEVPVLDVIIQETGIGVLPYACKSGGERVKVSLATALALAEIKSSKSGMQFGFLFLDEPPFLDEAGTETYCDSLDTIRMRYQNMKIIAITHDENMKSRFTQSMVVRKDDVERLSYIA
jgi:exonuclease SbcC